MVWWTEHDVSSHQMQFLQPKQTIYQTRTYQLTFWITGNKIFDQINAYCQHVASISRGKTSDGLLPRMPWIHLHHHSKNEEHAIYPTSLNQHIATYVQNVVNLLNSSRVYSLNSHMEPNYQHCEKSSLQSEIHTTNCICRFCLVNWKPNRSHRSSKNYLLYPIHTNLFLTDSERPIN